MPPRTKNALLAVISLLVIACSAAWIYYYQFKAPKHDVGLHQRIGEIMAEQTASLVGPKGRLVLITIPTGPEPELRTQLEAFRRRLKTLGEYDFKEHELDTKDQPKYSLGAGLSGRRFVRTVKNNPKADGIVSFVGAPKLSDEELADLSKAPKFIAEARSPDQLPKLFQKQIIQVAIVSRFVFPAPDPRAPKTPQQWFDKRYQIVTADAAKTIPETVE
ncbi:MAG TPA: hypothetical protein VL361_10475 [Candidatus Limnocylindrales bacterium]|nr:hypothetical protein [Candidatus Limnocylindrales bacterium]